MQKYIIRNSLVRRKYYICAFFGILIAIIATVMDTLRLHVILARQMLAIEPKLADSFDFIVSTGHSIYKAAACIGIIGMFAGITPIILSLIGEIAAGIKDGSSSDESEKEE